MNWPVDLTTEFDGYETLREEAEITALTTESEVSEALSDGQRGTIITDRTPFYATMGGQEGDRGVISCAGGEFVVEDAIHLRGGKVGHVGYVSSGMLKVGDKVTLSVDDLLQKKYGKEPQRHPSAAEGAENSAGKHVEQKGSLVTPDRLRFDFCPFPGHDPEEISRVEEMVNDQISQALDVRTDIMSLEEAKKTGAMALFDEKYGDRVRVVSMENSQGSCAAVPM